MILNWFKQFLCWRVLIKNLKLIYLFLIELADPEILDIREVLKKYGNENPGKKY